MRRYVEYRFPDESSSLEAIGPALARMGLSLAGAAVTSRVTYLDTFDGRLFRQGKVFEVECRAKAPGQWVLRDFRGRDFELAIRGDSVTLPCRPEDVADRTLRDALTSLIDIRALLPQAEISRKRQSLQFLSGEDSLPVDVRFDTYAWSRGRADAPSPVGRLVMVLRESAGKSLRHKVDDWAEQRDLAPVAQDVWLETLHAIGKPGGPGFAADAPDLTPDLRADLAAKRILKAQCAVLRAQEPGILANLDSEFLHDFRVAVRRSRSLLSQLKDILPERTIATFRRELAWLGTVSSPARDADVCLLDFPEMERVLPEFLQADLAPLRTLLQAHVAASHRDLVRHLQSSRYRRFLERWEAFLSKPVPSQPSAPLALLPFRKVAGRRIWKLYRRVLRQGRGLGEDVSAATVHEHRKLCKKIRYLTEFIAPLEGEESLRKPIKELKSLQTRLGAFQDAEVQISHLRAWSVELANKSEVQTPTLLALGALIGYHDQRQRSWRGGLAAAVKAFGEKENRERFKRLADSQD